MSNSNLLQQDATAWLLAIGQRLRVEYEDLAEPMPPRLTALLKLFESAAGETVYPCGSHSMAGSSAPPSTPIHTDQSASWRAARNEGPLEYTSAAR